MASILLVDRSDGSSIAARAALAMAGHEVLVADHPSMLHAPGARRFDLVLVDLKHAAHAGGLGALSSKVVLFSEASEEETRELVRRSGVGRYIRKLGPQRLLEDVQHVLSH